jgi:hypothetical protein
MGKLDDERPRRRPRRNEDEDDDRPRKRRARDDDEEDDSPRSRAEDAGDEEWERRGPPPRESDEDLRRRGESRVYVHDACGGGTRISGDDFARLTNPFCWVTSTLCRECEGFFKLRQFTWDDTGEDLASYRRRLRRRAPLSLKLWGFVLGPLLGAGLCALIGVALAKDRIAGAIGGAAAGILIVPAFLIPYLSKWIWGIDYRRKK